MTTRRQAPGADSARPIRAHCEGYLAQGPGFYVWDENPSEVASVARLFGSAAVSSASPRADEGAEVDEPPL